MTVHQGSLNLGPEERVRRGEPSPIAQALATQPCPFCHEPIVIAHDTTTGEPIALDPGPRAYFVIGERTDGLPLVAHTSNGLMGHTCREAVS